MVQQKGDPTDERGTDTRERTLSRRRLLQLSGGGLVASTVVMSRGDAQEQSDRLEIVAPEGIDIQYQFTCGDTVALLEENSVTDAETYEEHIQKNDDGMWKVTGSTADGYADAFELDGDVHSFQVDGGDYQLYRNGNAISREELVEPPTRRLEITTPPDGSVTYSLRTTGEIFRVINDTDLTAETSNEDVAKNDDGTWTVTGRTGNGYGDTIEFLGNVVEFTPLEGQFSLSLDGQTVSTYELAGVNLPEHSYSFEGTGDTPAEYYLEVQDGGDLIASTKDGAVIESDFHWISDDGTRAAGRVDPGERHAYRFDNLVVDVTIDGDASAFVDGRPSDLSRYPQAGAAGDDWKHGFPWQQGADATTLGGGAGYVDTISKAAADTVARTRGGLKRALASAASGDVVFLANDINLGRTELTVPPGVTLASDRGVDGSPGSLIYTNWTGTCQIRAQERSRVTGIRLRGLHPGQTVTESNPIDFAAPEFAIQCEGRDIEIDNCELWGHANRAVHVNENAPNAHVHHSYIYDNNAQGLGYGVAMEANALVEYNYFNNNRHSVSAAPSTSYIARYNHFGPKSVRHIIDAHDPYSGTAVWEHNIVENDEPRTADGEPNWGCAGYGNGITADGRITIRDNWFFLKTHAFQDIPGQAPVENDGNFYGSERAHDPSAVIPGHPGMGDRPWD
ncbi:hypothetical protein Huta_0485 [Halorhabdus utahensis DSM 12940]|uniref:Right handed beta helix domain-containing protein n=1 Tax=Halorhabdus utahensis (strain DSM 12940 / JCM 11049 / AX-2) TaxID=519442 RepID=C7NS65_HALUD|nr:hypothetical protein [Halorhabdus utahensis]ACV10672.1 hypothetical protein Huta_0485 [Halorhabdus utahensis DSM 12940]